MVRIRLLTAASISLLMAYSETLIAHGRFILPTHTVMSGDDEKALSLVSSISNDIFHPDLPLADDGDGQVPKPLQGLFNSLQTYVIDPKGHSHPMQWRAHARLSVADLVLKQAGSYRVVIQQPATAMTTFKTAAGTPGRVFGGQPLPEDVTDVVRRQVSSRVETYISLNGQDRKALTPTGKGLELVAEHHPNDLFVNEPLSMQLVFNGKPLQQTATVHVQRGGTRHRNQREEMTIKTDARGRFELNFDQSGFYLLEAEVDFPGEGQGDFDMIHTSLYVTLEVFPE